MAEINFNDIPNIDVDWQGYSGQSVQRFIKAQLSSKMGYFYYDATSNRYLVFASEEKKDEYLSDITQTSLILGTFEAPFNYTAEINMSTPSYNAIFLNSSGNYLDFTFNIKNKQGASTGENVTITYTFIRNATKQTFTETRKFGDLVHFNIDKYLGEGTNMVMISVVGQTSLAATSASITYQVVNLVINDEFNIANVYNLSQGPTTMEVPFSVSGYGTKIVEWYIDGEILPFVKNEDEVVDVNVSRIKYITLSNLSQGRHSLQIRAYTTINGDKFYTDTLYRDILVYTGANDNLAIGVAITIPRQYGIIEGNGSPILYGVIQYIPYTLRFATYTPRNIDGTEVNILIDENIKGVVSSSNNIENNFTFIASSSGNKQLEIKAANVSYIMPIEVAPTTMDIEEITSTRVLYFNALGKSNNSQDREQWIDGKYIGTLEGFNFNSTSGWVNGRLEMNAGSTFSINLAPLAGVPTNTGKTIEIEWSTKKVSDDNAIICDLRGDNGAGILITATKVSLISANGVVVETEYKSDENVRIGFVINRSSGVSEQRLSYIYTNGIVSKSDAWATTDSYTSFKNITFTASDSAEISLKSITVYDSALSANNMLNNFTLYRDTVAEMMEVYDRNDVYEEGTTIFSPGKMAARLPIMIITGDIPTLENTSDKDTQIVVDVEYTNLQNPKKSFKMKGAAMRPQGTSSMGYPKKNFRIYTTKLDSTIVYDADGNEIENKLYAFKDNAQPVDCWCLKADYAESSGTHNTSIARMWNNALFNAQIDGEYKLRTNAQIKALEAGYPYDVRTTIDGFPILLFYRQSQNDDLIFIGKYNFNNDKSTESVFGFRGIPNFDNSKMQCWEVLNNGNALALFNTIQGFDEGWSEAFESRYPDTKNPDTTDLKAFATWMSSVSQEDFATEKWEHLDIYKMAAYWIYLNRYAGADQFVKNSMFTSEDGKKFYFILYDNDTINGLVNTGRLLVPPTADRQTKDESGEYYFAGHDSRLWNMLEADDEFKSIVSTVDNALYSAGISYANTINMFDNEQADKWVERVYNQDAQYKYIGPYVEKGVNNLFMLQGKRDLHRKWWLAKRFSIYDAKYVSGTYKSQAIELKCINNTPTGQQFTITSGYPLDYGYGINNIPRSFGITLDVGESHTFTTKEVVNLGDPIRIYGASNIAELDLSAMANRLAVVTISNVYDEANGTKLTKLIVGNKDVANLEVADISGLKQAIALEYLDIQGMSKITSLDLTNHKYIKTVKAKGSGMGSITFAKGAPVNHIELPSSMGVLKFEQLPYLSSTNIHLENIANVYTIDVKDCPNISNDFNFVWSWINSKTTNDSSCTLVMDKVNWSGVSGEQMAKIASLGNVVLKGKITLTNLTKAQGQIITNKLGDTIFTEGAELYIDAPSTVSITCESSVLEGNTIQVEAEVYPPLKGTMKYTLATTRQGVSINANTGLITIAETGAATSNIVVRAIYTRDDGEPSLTMDATIQVIKRVYPSNATINGDDNPIINNNYTWSTNTSDITGEFDVEWNLSGDITNYFNISSSNAQSCSLAMTFMPLGTINGTLTLTIKKKYNGEVVLTSTKTLSALDANVIITLRSNAPIQAALYNAGLVANETHTLKHEAEKITAAQLQPGTTATTSIFYAKRNDITHFEEFRYFTGLTTVPKYLFNSCIVMTTISLPNTVTSIGDNVFQRCDALTTIELPSSLKSLGSATFYGCAGLVEVIIPEGVTGCSANCFHDCRNLERLVIPSTFKSVGGNCFGGCGKLNFEVAASNTTYKAIDGVLYNAAGTTLIEYAKDYIQPNYTIAEGTTTLGNYSFCNCYYLTSVVLPSTLKTVGLGSFAGATKLSSITCNAVIAPTANGSDAFGKTTSNYTGREAYNTGNNMLRIPLNASGYDAGQWLDPLQSADKCGFSVYGKLTLASNRSDAQFNVKYTTEANTSKTVTVGVGTCYLNDIKYDTSITITPIVISGYIWNSESITFIYNSSSYSASFNAYIYPTSVAISGTSALIGGNDATYVATISPSNIDVDVTYSWSISGANATIATTNGNQCTIATTLPSDATSATLTCVVKSLDNRVTVQQSYTITINAKPNFITARYNVTSTTSPTQLLYKIDNIYYMEIDGVEVTPTRTYTFASTGQHVVKISIAKGVSLKNLFDSSKQMTYVDFSEFDGGTYTDVAGMFNGCSKLENIIWGECSFPKVATLNETFQSCTILTNIDLSPFKDASIQTMISTFSYCRALIEIDLKPLKKSPIVNLESAFRSCESLDSLNFDGLDNLSVFNLNHTFNSCTSIKVLNLRNLKTSTSLQTLNYTFSRCTNLRLLITPWESAPSTNAYTFGFSAADYTGKATASTGQNMLIIPENARGYDQNYWGSSLLNSSKCGFTIGSNGVYIQHTNGLLYDVNTWSSAGFANNLANGVAILSDESNFVVSKINQATGLTTQWSTINTLISNIVTTTNRATAILDFNGKTNTEEIIAQLGESNAPAAMQCVNYTFPNGKKGYLPAAGQLQIILNNKTEFDSAIEAIGGEAFYTGNATWSSTQQDTTSVWVGFFSSSSSISTQNKNFKRAVRAFTTL